VCEKRVPNVLAFPLEEALEALSRAGVTVHKTLPTAPPHAGKGEGRVRVVQQLPGGSASVDLVIAFERYPRESGRRQRP
jgi:hypothetical protein